jgi:CHAT domain-containing protein
MTRLSSLILLVLAYMPLTAQRPADPLAAIRRIEAEGEDHYRRSDIGEAERLWTDALHQRQRAFGDSSAEAAVGYAYQTRYHSYMSGPQAGHGALAWDMAQRARRKLGRSDRVDPGERVLILREYAYAYKISQMRELLEKHDHLERTRQHFREALRSAVMVHDTIWTAQIHHDIGNTFTDEAGHYQATWSRSRIRSLVDSALSHYGRSIDLMVRAHRGLSEAVMMDQLCTGLLYKDAYGPDSSAQAVAAFDRGLMVMLRAAGAGMNDDPLGFDPMVANKAQMVELLYLRSLCFVSQYEEHPDTSRIRLALQSLEAAVPYWQAMLLEYRSRDVYKVIGSYSHFPFNYGTYLAAELYLLNHDEKRLEQAVSWCDMNRDGLEQREMLLRGRTTIPRPGRIAAFPEHRPPHGTAWISYHTYPRALAFIIDEQGVRIMRLQPTREEPYPFTKRIAALNDAMRSRDVQAYERVAHDLFTFLLAPLLTDTPYSELVIVPAGPMERIPFEALVRDTVEGTDWSDLDYVLRGIRIRYARTLDEASRPPEQFSMGQARWAIVQAHDRSELPFAQQLVERMARAFGNSAPTKDPDAAELRALLRNPSMLHLASHAEAPSAPDAMPFIALRDGPFTIAGIDSVGCANTLVTLSTCSSGEGPVFIGEGGLSLGRAFLRSGAHMVVQTCWPVDDQATSELLTRMYDHIHEGASVADALHQAKLEHLRAHAADPLANPFYWSGVIAVGVDQRTEESYSTWRWFAGSGLALLIGAWIYRRFRRSRARTET